MGASKKKTGKVGEIEWLRVSSQFCPVADPMKTLEKNIKAAKKNGELFEAKYLEGVRYCRIIVGASLGLDALIGYPRR